MLDISRLDAGILEVRPRLFLIGLLIERICRDHVEEAEQKGVDLSFCPTSLLVDSDPVLVERILRNLVSNAVRYTDHGCILVGCRRRDSGAAVQVWDTGRGVPPDQQERIFQDYYQLGNLERDRAWGLGLRLAIVRRLTELLGARLTLRSQLGRGSCFEIVLARGRGAIVAETAAAGALRDTLAHGLIVVIDDEADIRDAMARLLTGWGYEVVVAGSGPEAI